MSVKLEDAEAYVLFLILDSLARSTRGEDVLVNHLRERLLPVYRDWHAANPHQVHPGITIPSTHRGTPE